MKTILNSVLLVALAAVFTTAASGCTMVNHGDSTVDQVGRSHTSAAPADLIFIVNPSPLAERNELEHVKQVIQATARPNLSVVGLWEQRTSDDGYFERPFLSTSSPDVSSSLRTACPGTDWQKSTCRRDESAQEALNARQLTQWETHVGSEMATVEQARRTEVKGRQSWHLHAALLQAAQIVGEDPASRRCIIVLGGLFTMPPKGVVPARLLSHSELIIGGWRGTESVRGAWEAELLPAGVRVTFLPQAVTSLRLASSVEHCLNGNPS